MGIQNNDVDQRGREAALGILTYHDFRDVRDNTAAEAALATDIVTSVAPTLTLKTHALVANKPDIPRNLTYTLVDAGPTVTGITFTAYGLDQWGNTVTESVRLTAAGVSTGNKPFRTVSKVTSIVDAGTVGVATVTVGTGTKLGLPVRCEKNSDIIALRSESAGTYTKDASTSNVNFEYQTWDPTVAPNGTKTFSGYFMSKAQLPSNGF